MPGELILTWGTNQAKIPLAGTNAKINAVVMRFLAAKGVSTEGLTAVQVGEVFLLELKKLVMDMSRDAQRAELVTANSATVEATVAADNEI